MNPTDFAKLLQESNKENNVILMENLKKSIKEELTIFKHYIENMVGEALCEVNGKVMELEEMIQEKDHEIMTLKEELENSRANTSELRKDILNLTSTVEKLGEKSTSLDVHSRKRNVVLYQVAETEKSNFELLKMVHNLVKNTADIHFKESDIEYVHRIGRKGLATRPIRLGLTRVHKRNHLLNKSKSFNNKRMSIDEDLPKNILVARKPIYKLVRHLSQEGKRAIFRKDKLVVDGVEWSTERAHQALRQLPSSDGSQR